MPPENLQALKRWRDVKANVPLATGERLFSKWEFRELIEQQIVDIVQPGHLPRRRHQRAEEDRRDGRGLLHQGRAAQPERPGRDGGVGHLSAAIPNFLILETAKDEPYRSLVQKQGLKIEDGWIELPSTPGPGRSSLTRR